MTNFKRAGRAGSLIAAALLMGLVVGSAGPGYAGPSAPEVTTRISPTPAFDAPIGKNGGVENPVAWCSDYSEPKTKWTLTNTVTGWTKSYRWKGSLPGLYFPRVPVGEYESKAAASCRGVLRHRTETIVIKEKTWDGTVSKSEWRQVQVGMTRKEVAHVIGNNGRDPFRWDGRLGVTYDMMAFWRWSTIYYREGRVVDMEWNIGHD